MKLFNFLKKKPIKREPYYSVKLLEHEHKINTSLCFTDGTYTNVTYVYGYEDGWLKLCCFGGQAHKIECDEKDVPSLILPIIDQNMTYGEVADYCKDWANWNYYDEFFSQELIIP